MEIQNIDELKTILGLAQNESIHVEKNSKGYNWDYKLLGRVEESIDNRVDNIEQKLKERFDKDGK